MQQTERYLQLNNSKMDNWKLGFFSYLYRNGWFKITVSLRVSRKLRHFSPPVYISQMNAVEWVQGKWEEGAYSARETMTTLQQISISTSNGAYRKRRTATPGYLFTVLKSIFCFQRGVMILHSLAVPCSRVYAFKLLRNEHTICLTLPTWTNPERLQ
jgi:hypothetical protein